MTNEEQAAFADWWNTTDVDALEHKVALRSWEAALNWSKREGPVARLLGILNDWSKLAKTVLFISEKLQEQIAPNRKTEGPEVKTP